MSVPTSLSFSVTHEAWYRMASEKPRIMIGLYYDDGGTDGEFSIRWETLGDKLVPQLCMFTDSWKCLNSPDFVRIAKWMERHDSTKTRRYVTPEEVKAALLEAGLVDRTERKRPGNGPKVSVVDAIRRLQNSDHLRREDREMIGVIEAELGQ